MADSADTTNLVLRKCSVEECDRRQSAKGLCRPHYERQRRWGRLHLVRSAAPKGSTERWLKEHVDHDGADCLFWPYARNEQGYGTATVGGYYTLAHRHMCILAHGEPPFPKAEAAHFCGGGANGCVNPKHVRWATRSVNQMDKTLHGTHYVYQQKVDASDAVAIFNDPRPHSLIAKDYGCTPSHVGSIKRGRNWGHVTGQKPVDPVRTILDAETVRAIYLDGRSNRKVAREYGCSRHIVWMIRAGRTHRELTRELQREPVCEGHKLSHEQVRAIYNGHQSALETATAFGCSTALVYHIRNGRAWSSVTGHKRHNAS